METILWLLFLFLILGGWRLVVRLFHITSGAASDAASGRASFKEGFGARTKGMSKFEINVEDTTFGEDRLPVWKISIRGLFPIAQSTNLGVAISLLDVTENDNAQPIFAAFDEFQESDTRAFQLIRPLVKAEPGQGFLHWLNVGAVPKDLLMFPHSGERKIGVIVRLVDMGQMPLINHGFCNPNFPGLLAQLIHTKSLSVERGFLERSDDELGIAAASIRLGLSLAYSDGNFDPFEGKLIKDWAAKFVNEVPEGKGRDKARAFINDAIRYGNEDAREQNLSISQQVEVINKLADKPEKYAAIELCLDVMAADGSADQEELRMLNSLCESLGLDKDRFDELRDHRMINVEAVQVDGSNIWESLGINSSASDDEKKGELKKLYRRWNARAESLEDEVEREKAHAKLELIAEARSLLNA